MPVLHLHHELNSMASLTLVCVTDNPVSKIIELKNVGMAIGECEIEYDDDLPIKIEGDTL